MNISFLHSRGAEAPIKIPAIGLDLFVRMPPSASGGEFCFIETINAPGAGPPRGGNLSRPRRALSLRDGRTAFLRRGRRRGQHSRRRRTGFVNVTDKPARQYILTAPALDAEAFFTELAATMRNGIPDQALLNAIGVKWSVEFLGPPLKKTELPTE
jgi:hypothetical protein